MLSSVSPGYMSIVLYSVAATKPVVTMAVGRSPLGVQICIFFNRIFHALFFPKLFFSTQKKSSVKRM